MVFVGKEPDEVIKYAKELGEGISNHEDVESMKNIINSIEMGFSRYIQELTDYTKDKILTLKEAEKIHKSAVNIYRTACKAAAKNRRISYEDARILTTLMNVLGLEPEDLREIHADVMETLIGIKD